MRAVLGRNEAPLVKIWNFTRDLDSEPASVEAAYAADTAHAVAGSFPKRFAPDSIRAYHPDAGDHRPASGFSAHRDRFRKAQGITAALDVLAEDVKKR
jgi:hypothetical protein